MTTIPAATTFAFVPAAAAPTTSQAAPFAGGVRGGPRALLQIEGALMLGGALLAYARLGGSWGWFAALFLLPDLSMLGYLWGRRLGAVLYNAAHSLLVPALLLAAWLALSTPAALLGAALWTAHIGFDRMLGYGLKYGTAFGDTHLGQVGRRALERPGNLPSVVRGSGEAPAAGDLAADEWGPCHT